MIICYPAIDELHKGFLPRPRQTDGIQDLSTCLTNCGWYEKSKKCWEGSIGDVLPRSSMTMRTMFGGWAERTTSWVKRTNKKRAMKGMEALVLRGRGLAPLPQFTVAITFTKSRVRRYLMVCFLSPGFLPFTLSSQSLSQHSESEMLIS